MTIEDFLRKKNISRYQLSEDSGIPWEMLASICSGAVNFKECDTTILEKFSKALGITTEELFQMEQENNIDAQGKPQNKEYLETGLPLSLNHALNEYIEGEKNKVSHLDCLWGELYGSINACQSDGRITKEQAEYLREKYLWG